MAHDAVTDTVNPAGGTTDSTTDADATQPESTGQMDAQQLARDWITIWHSELRAMAADPEIRETWQSAVSLWAAGLSSVLYAWPQPLYDRAAEPARASAAAGTPSSAAAPDPRGAEIERLSRQVADLEHRLAELERGDGPPGGRDVSSPGSSRR